MSMQRQGREGRAHTEGYVIMPHDHPHRGQPLQGKRGRPRKPLPGPDPTHKTGTISQTPREPRVNGVNGDDERGALARLTVVPITPRLLDLSAAAAYLGLSVWTVRDLEGTGTLARVRIPMPNNGELRKLLFDRTDLDELIERWKDGPCR